MKSIMGMWGLWIQEWSVGHPKPWNYTADRPSAGTSHEAAKYAHTGDRLIQ
ncbi:MAG: hypothetical protein V4587_03015 [Acidobacteriota bacterium]